MANLEHNSEPSFETGLDVTTEKGLTEMVALGAINKILSIPSKIPRKLHDKLDQLSAGLGLDSTRF